MIAREIRQNTHKSDGRYGQSDGRCYGQKPRRYWDVMTVMGKTTCAYTYRPQMHSAIQRKTNGPRTSTNTHHTHHTHHTLVNTRIPEVMGKFFTHNAHHMTHPAPKKPLRQTMPTVAGWIDELRSAFGADSINDAIRAGMDSQPTFWAEENGQQAGTKPASETEESGCVSCAHLGGTRFSSRYCGGRMDLPPAYGDSHPLRHLPEDGGATCKHYLHYSEEK